MNAAGTDPHRRAELAKIHILAIRAGLIVHGDDSAYRDMLRGRTGLRSAADMDRTQRQTVIRHLTDSLPNQRPYPRRPRNTKQRRELSKIEALLADAGRPWAYAEGILKHMTRGRKQRLEFADARELAAVLTALEKDALKRLRAQLDERLAAQGHDWTWAQAHAESHCGLSKNSDLTRSTECMSRLLRRLRHAPASQ